MDYGNIFSFMSAYPKVQVLLATYNGEKFLPEQLDSLLSQTYPDVEILARDDGSKDNTPQILRAYQLNHPGRINIVNDGEGNLGGYTQNFQRLCDLSTTPVIAFSDQDDVWNPEKVAKSVDALLKLEERWGQDKPLLVHHDFTFVDAEKTVLHESFDRANGNRKAHPPKLRMPFAADVHGFSMTVNRALLDVALPFPEVANGHDSVLGCLASDIGAIDFIPEQLALYRRHGKNTSHVGISFARRSLTKLLKDGTVLDIPKNLRVIFDEVRSNVDLKRTCARSYIETYRPLISEEHLTLLEKYAQLDELSAIDRKIVLCSQPGMSWKTKLLLALTL
jgi:glycosyltransferase involved in cell wall biosynthesis